MAKRKSAAVEAIEPPAQEAAPPAAATTPEEPPAAEPRRPWRQNPFPSKTINLSDGYRIELQEYRPEKESHPNERWQMLIKFGDGRLEDRPPAAVIDFLKSHKIKVETREGPREINQFRWNDEHRAWGMAIDFDMPATSRRQAEKIFEQAVDLAAQERGVSRERATGVPF
jgi:hypothetical protein